MAPCVSWVVEHVFDVGGLVILPPSLRRGDGRSDLEGFCQE